LTSSLQDSEYRGESVPVTEVTGFTTQPLRGFRFPGGERYYSRWFQPPVVPTEDLSPEGTLSKKVRPADARAVVPGTHFPDDPEIHLEKQKKIWVKGRASALSLKISTLQFSLLTMRVDSITNDHYD
jgi:hypothetical protein